MLVLFKTKLDARTQTTADAKLVRLCDRAATANVVALKGRARAPHRRA